MWFKIYTRSKLKNNYYLKQEVGGNYLSKKFIHSKHSIDICDKAFFSQINLDGK
jgi:hypothetical protein